jgi:hypothetical protein
VQRFKLVCGVMFLGMNDDLVSDLFIPDEKRAMDIFRGYYVG